MQQHLALALSLSTGLLGCGTKHDGGGGAEAACASPAAAYVANLGKAREGKLDLTGMVAPVVALCAKQGWSVETKACISKARAADPRCGLSDAQLMEIAALSSKWGELAPKARVPEAAAAPAVGSN